MGGSHETVCSRGSTHAGDFSKITDFQASIECDSETVEIDWRDEELEFTFNDAMYPCED